MNEPSFLGRIALAFALFFRVLFDRAFAGRALALRRGADPDPAPALLLLAALQRDGRLVDFAMEEIAACSDAEVSAAARAVHDGVRKALTDAFHIVPVRAEAEGARVVLPPGFDAAQVRLAGNVSGGPPFAGTLRHHGWRVAEVRLARALPGHDAAVIAPADIEL